MYGFGWGYDPTFIILLPAIIFAFYAQSKVSSAFSRYSRIRSSYGYTGYEVARRLLDSHGLYDVPIERIGGRLSDHYDPRHRVLRLSSDVYNSNSVAALGIAAHECGHAIQHQEGYAPLVVRNAIAPIASIGSQAAWIFFLAGFILNSLSLIDLGILLFTGAVIFQVITLPVEFNASNRAIALLEGNGLVPANELGSARKVLNAAALTYVAAALAAVAQLARFLLIRNSRD